MKTLVITIDELVGGDYPVAVYFDDGTAAWRTTPKKEGVIGEGLARPPFPNDAAGQPLDADAIVAFLRMQDRPSAVFGSIGQHLWSLFERSAVGETLDGLWKAHARTNRNDVKEGIRTVLDVRPKALRALPWELMIRDHVPLFAAPLNPIVRGLLAPPAAPPGVGFLLRVLVVVGSRLDDAAVKAEEEIDFLADAARNFRREIDLHVESRPSQDSFVEAYKDFMPHVLHFIGHGELVARPRQASLPSLVLEGASGGRWDWTVPDIKATLAVGAPRLAFLNACRSGAAAGADPRQVVGALSDEFLGAGTLGVVAMQADISGAVAAEFSGATYAALAQGQPLDVALAEARYTVRERREMADRRDWCLPSLTVGVDVSAVLPARLELPQERRDRLQTTPEFVRIQAFVDRRIQRREVDPMAARNSVEDILIVTGPPKTGKTAMLMWFLEGCAWCGHAVKYVDLKVRGRPGFLEVLEWIHRADTSELSDLRQALAGDFSRVQQLSAVIRTGQPGPAGTPDDPVDALFGAFRAALTASAGGNPLIIALDHVGSMDPAELRRYLRPYLLDHVVQRRMRPVRFVLCCTDDEYRDLQMNTLAPAHIVNVGPFPAAEFTSLLRDYMLCRGVPRARLPPPLPSPQQDFRPEMLEKAYELLKELGTIGN